MQVRHREAGQPGLGPRAAAGRALVADLAAGAGGRAREGRDRRRVVVRLHLHQHVRDLVARAVERRVGVTLRQPAPHRPAFHHRGVVVVGDDGALRRNVLGVADHREHRLRLVLPVDAELRIEDLVPAMLAVGLREHHQLDVARVAAELRECIDQVVDLVLAQRQAEAGVGRVQRRSALPQYIHVFQRRRRLLVEQMARGLALEGHALGHAVVQQRRDGCQRVGRQRLGRTEQAALQSEPVFDDTFDALHRQAAVVGDVGGFAGPRRHRAQPRHDDNQRARGRLTRRVAIAQQRFELVHVGRLERGGAAHPVHVPRRQFGDAPVDALQPQQQAARAEGGQGVAAFEMKQGRLGHAVAPGKAKRGKGCAVDGLWGHRRASPGF